MLSADDIDGRVRWEYTYFITPVGANDLVETLDNLGTDGWEIASTDIFQPLNEPRPLMSIILKRFWKFDDDLIPYMKQKLEEQSSQDE